MLWNVDKNNGSNYSNRASPPRAKTNDTDTSTPVEEGMLKIGSTKTTVVDSKKKIMGHALTIKEEFVRQQEDDGEEGASSSFGKLLEICNNVRKSAADILNKNGCKYKIYSQFLESSCEPCADVAQPCFFPIQGYDND